MSLAPGTRLGAYDVVGLLGAGGMGEVYRARDTRLGRDVAIKLVTAARHADARAQLQREARAAAALNHPHICTIHEIAEHDDQLFIVMEHVDGRPLSAVAAEPLPASTVVRYGMQIADALAHAHERGVIHRDLKCANLMITAEGRVKVLDFGIATLGDDAAALAATRVATTPGTVAGTIGYMAPEVLKGVPADRRSDIWALGVVLYEMASGRRPFEGNTSFEITSAILRDDPGPLPRRAGAPLEAIVARCLAKDPALRYQQAGEVRAALDAVATLTPVRQPSVERVDEGRRAAASPRPAAASGAKAIVVLPFANLSPNPEDAFLADGFTEEIITDLSRIRGLRVISRNSSMQLRGTAKDICTIGRDFRVDYALEGSVRRAGDSFRVTTQLVETETDSQVWAERFTGTTADIFDIQERIARSISEALAITLSSSDQRRLVRQPFRDLHAYEWYLRARQLNLEFTTSSIGDGLLLVDRALEREGEHAALLALKGYLLWNREHCSIDCSACREPGRQPRLRSRACSSASAITIGHSSRLPRRARRVRAASPTSAAIRAGT